MNGITFRAQYLPEHVENPILPQVPEELAAVVDRMNAQYHRDCDYLTVVAIDPEGPHIASLGVGVAAGENAGSIYFIGPNGAFFSKGDEQIDEPLVYYDFGNARYFAPDSKIPLSDLKRTLILLFKNEGERPNNIQWQDWFDAEPD